MNSDAQLFCVTHLGENPADYLNAVVPPIFSNSLHVYDSVEGYENGGYIYGRHSNPLVEIVEAKLAALEGGEKALLFGSGMAAAATAIMHAAAAGDHIICQETCYNPIKNFFDRICVPKLKMEITYMSCLDLDEIEGAVKPNTKLILIESPSTFVFDIADIGGVVKIARKHGIRTYIDNTYCTPLFQNPLALGVDYVMHTASKYLGGHSDLIAGALIVKDWGKTLQEDYRELFGGILGPFEAWLMLRGMRTLHARLIQHQQTALEAARYLQSHPKVKTVYHPGLPEHPGYALGKKQMSGYTGLFSIELDATEEQSVKFCDALKLFSKGCSWGGFESLAIMPLRLADDALIRKFHASRKLIRLHCGLEGAQNLLADLEQALNKI